MVDADGALYDGDQLLCAIVKNRKSHGPVAGVVGTLMTNMAAGLSAEALTHSATLQQAQASGAFAAQFLTDLIASLADVDSLQH